MSDTSHLRYLAFTSFVSPILAVALVLTVRKFVSTPEVRYFAIGLIVLTVCFVGIIAAAVVLVKDRTGGGVQAAIGLAANLVAIALFSIPALV